MPSDSRPASDVALLADGRLRLELRSPHLTPAARAWLPRSAGPEADAGPEAGPATETGPASDQAPGAGGVIVVQEAADPSDPSDPAPPADPAASQTPATLRLGTVDAWLEPGRATLRGDLGGRGRVELDARRAVLTAPGDRAGDVYSMLTIAAALLLTRLGRALVHAAAIVAPDGRAWLLAGDARAGKTTTLAALMGAGRPWLSDDHVVLDAAGQAEGWPRAFHLDTAWEGDRPTGQRMAVDPDAVAPGLWRATAPVGGVLLPRVEPGSATALEPASSADALAMLVRQSPWLLADPAAAPAALELLRGVAALPAARLRLGLDSYGDGQRLARILTALPGWGEGGAAGDAVAAGT